MTTPQAGRLAYWRLGRAERRAVRRIERTCRAVGDSRLDAIARARLERAAHRERLCARLAAHLAARIGGRPADERLARLACTMRHPSRGSITPG